MAEQMTVDEARRLIELCREVDGKATPGPWAWSTFAEKSNSYEVGVAVRMDGTPVCGRFEFDRFDERTAKYVEDVLAKEDFGGLEGSTVNYGNPDAMVLWRAGFGALLELAAKELKHEYGDDDKLYPEGDLLYDHLAPLAAWADREHAGWRTQ